MNEGVRVLLLLLRLRLRLFLRRGTNRYTRSARLAAPLRVIGMIVLILLFVGQITVFLTIVLGDVLGEATGRLLITPILTAASAVVSVFIFLYAILAVVAALTYRSDLGLLLLTPLSPRLVLGEKFFTVAGSFMALLLVIGGPILVGGGSGLHLGLTYALTALFVLLLLPIVPVSLALLLALTVLRWLPPARTQSIITVLGWLSGAAFYIGSQLVAARAARAQISTSSIREGWWSALPVAWPGHALAAAALGKPATAVAYLLASVLLAALLGSVAIELSARLFATGWATYQEVGRGRAPKKLLAVGNGEEAVRPSGGLGTVSAPAGSAIRYSPPSAGLLKMGWAWRWLVRKEWLTVRRDSQLLARLAYVLLLVGFLFYRNFVSRPAAVGGRTHAFTVGSLYVVLTFIVVFLLSTLALSVVNREGRSLYLLALSPLTAREIVVSKWAFCVTPVLILVEVVLIGSAVAAHQQAGEILLGALAMASVIVAVGGELITVSLLWPRLDWDNPRQQVTALAFVVGDVGALIIAGGACVLLIVAFVVWSQIPWVAVIAAAGIFALTGAVSVIAWFLAPRRLQALLVRD